MEYRRACYAIVFFILLCALCKGNSEDKQSRLQSWFLAVAPPLSGDMALTHSRKELVDLKKAKEGVDFDITSEATIYFKSILLKQNLLKTIEILRPQAKQTLWDCLHENGASSNNWFIGCLESLFDWPNVSRRRLASDSDKPKRKVPSPPPSPSPSQSPSPSPSPSPASSKSPPVKHPKSSSIQPVTVNPFPVPSGYKEPPPSKPVFIDHQQKKSDGNIVPIVVAVAAAVVVLIILVAVVLVCRLSGEKTVPVVGIRDERPLLNISPGSSGSLPKTSSLGDTENKEFTIDGGKVLSSENNEVKAFASYDSIPPLKPPPGRQVAAPAPAEAQAPPASVEAQAQAPPASVEAQALAPPASVEAQAQAPPAPAEAQAPPPPPPAAPPAPLPSPPGSKSPPPPPPKVACAPPMPPKKQRGLSGSSVGGDGESGAPKAKLKPFFWDKVAASPNRSMVWNEIRGGSFQFNEEMMESLFGYANANQNKDQKRESSLEPQYIQLIDKRKAQNLSILLKALNVTTEEVCDALLEGNKLPVELISTLLKMAPSQEEELQLRLYSGDVMLLGPAEQFLKTLISIPFAYNRLESLLFMSNLHEEATGIKEALATLEVASNQLKNSRLFLKLLEAVLKTGNRMNDGTYRGGAQAFKLDTLLKLSDVKGTNGKTTLLHFVVQEIIRSEGVRAVRAASASQSISSVKSEDLSEDSSLDMEQHYRKLGLQVVSGLSNELEDVKKAAIIDADSLTSTLSQLGHSLVKAKEFMKCEAQNLGEGSDQFNQALTHFMESAEVEIKWLMGEEKRIRDLVKRTGEFFHGNTGKDEGLRLFTIVRDFLKMLDKVCKEIYDAQVSAAKTHKKDSSSASVSSASSEMQQQQQSDHSDAGPRRMDDSSSSSSSDSDSDSDDDSSDDD